MTITASIEVKNTGSPEFVVFETGDPQIWADEAITERHGSTLVARTTLEHSSGKSFALDRSKLRITILGQHSAIDIKGCQGG